MEGETQKTEGLFPEGSTDFVDDKKRVTVGFDKELTSSGSLVGLAPEELVELFWPLFSTCDLSDEDSHMLYNALELAVRSHDGAYRLSGEPYIVHPISVAKITESLGLGPMVVAAALLHDVIEDCGVSLEEVVLVIGLEGGFLVDGLTKVDRLKFDSRAAASAATLRKLLVAVAKDIRVLIVKLADRLHNMSTLGPLPLEKAERVAKETLEVYAPLAHRLGMGAWQRELEDLAFKTLHLDRYLEVKALVSDRSGERDIFLNEIELELVERLEAHSIKAQVFGRAKGLFSTYEKMVVSGKDFDQIHDLVGIRVVVDSVADCYGALGVVHSAWHPVPGRIKDYIAMPTVNGYQSLHTTVSRRGSGIEVQIRTHAMDEQAERGVCAHWGYKTLSDGKAATATKEPAWLKKLLENGKSTTYSQKGEGGDLLDEIATELGEIDEVVCFTPQGDLLALPSGSGPVDFAYAIHTEVGNHLTGARVNGKIVSLSYVLVSGDTVEILTAASGSPKEGWLKFVRTAKARGRIRKHLVQRERETSGVSGKDLLTKALRLEKAGIDFRGLSEDKTMLEKLGFFDIESLCDALYKRQTTATSIAHRIKDIRRREESGSKITASTPLGLGARSGLKVYVEGLSGVMVSLAKCCDPELGDAIVGFVTLGRGISVHKSTCHDLHLLEPARLVNVSWWEEDSGVLLTLRVEALDRKGLLGEVVRAMTNAGLDIVSSQTSTHGDKVAVEEFFVKVSGEEQLQAGLQNVLSVDGVFKAYKV